MNSFSCRQSGQVKLFREKKNIQVHLNIGKLKDMFHFAFKWNQTKQNEATEYKNNAAKHKYTISLGHRKTDVTKTF